MKKNEIVNPKYLPELEKRIAEKFDMVLNHDFPLFKLNEEESHELKQILKFLLGKKEQDAYTKLFDINRIRKYLLSNEERHRQQANLLLQVLRKMGHLSLVADITKKDEDEHRC